MERNMGRADRVLRFFLGLVLILAPLLNLPAVWGSAVLSYVSIAIGLVFLVTSFFGVCPIYQVLGIRTCRPS